MLAGDDIAIRLALDSMNKYVLVPSTNEYCRSLSLPVIGLMGVANLNLLRASETRTPFSDISTYSLRMQPKHSDDAIET